MSRRLLKPLLALVALALPAISHAIYWNPLDVGFLDSFDPADISKRMSEHQRFEKTMVERFYFSGPGIRKDFLSKWKAGTLRAEDGDLQKTMGKQLEKFKMLPLARFHFFEVEGANQARIEDFCANHGLHLHMFRKSSWMGLGVIGKRFHMLVSGADAGVAQMRQHFQHNIKYQDPVDEFRIELKYKVGGNWAEFLVPTAERYARDLGNTDVWTAAGMLSTLMDREAEGVKELIKAGFITIHQDKPIDLDSISKVEVKAFLPFHQEPFYEN